MRSRGWPGNLGEPSVSLRRKERCEEEVRPEGEIPASRGRPRHRDESAKAETQTEKTGQAGYPGRTEKIERPGDGLAAVLAEHSTDGRGKKNFADREGGEVTPKRPAVGKVRPGMTIR
ncbi:hypothetical protein QUF72_03680 [Desulfobacterales bacterium HSG2]|nr:hypothetical protein [Desulfobacterales bacterium HSG2]